MSSTRAPRRARRSSKGSVVDITVSNGQAEGRPCRRGREEPRRRGRTLAERRAGAARVPRGRRAKPRTPSRARTRRRARSIEKGSSVRINVSQGPSRVACRRSSGCRSTRRAPALQGAGLRGRARATSTASEPKDTVVDQSPSELSAPRGATVTLFVSKGPNDVDGPRRDEPGRGLGATRRSSSPASRSQVQRQDVTDPGLDGIVLTQEPGRRHEGEAGLDGHDHRRAAGRAALGHAAATATGPAVTRRVRVAVLWAAARASTRSRSRPRAR